MTVRNAYGEPIESADGGGKAESSIGRSTAGKITITIPIINGIIMPQRMVLSLTFPGSVNFYPLNYFTWWHIYKLNAYAWHAKI
jgi:hypothetical protein